MSLVHECTIPKDQLSSLCFRFEVIIGTKGLLWPIVGTVVLILLAE